MSIGALLDEVLDLQQGRVADPANTTAPSAPANIRRRALVEHEIVAWIRTVLTQSFPNWQARGSNGKGGSAEVPWSRFYDPALSPKPGEGWYVVYLFSATGDAVYLTLIQGTTTWDTGRKDFVFRTDEQLRQRVEWARNALTEVGAAPAVFEPIELHAKNRLGRVYQRGSVHSIEYRRGAIPSEDQLRADLLEMARLLSSMYDIDDLTAQVPGDEAPEIIDAELAADASAGNARRERPDARKRKSAVGQGFQLSQAEKVAIEQHAVEVAIQHFKGDGFKVKYTGDKKSYDLLVTSVTEEIYVEVKGTVSLGEQVIVTYNEVEHHRKHYPDNALVVVHSIELDRTQSPPIASGGTAVVHRPWKIDDAALKPISYRYQVSAT